MDEYMDYLKDKYIEKELSINEVLENFIGKIKYVQDFIQRDEFINKFASSFQITKVKIEKIINKEFIKIDSNLEISSTNRILSPEDIILKVFVEFSDSRDPSLMKKYSSILCNNFHEQILSLMMNNTDAEASNIIGKINEEALSSMISALIFTPYDIPEDKLLRKKLIEDCMKRIELDSIKDLKRLINLKLSKNAEIPEQEEKLLLNELRNLIEKEKALF